MELVEGIGLVLFYKGYDYKEICRLVKLNPYKMIWCFADFIKNKPKRIRRHHNIALFQDNSDFDVLQFTLEARKVLKHQNTFVLKGVKP